MSDTEISAEVLDAINAIVLEELGRFGIKTVEVVDAEDSDGDASILVLVHYERPDAEPDPQVASSLIMKLNDRLYTLKECD
ncbi:hypothetical protein [Methylobacterium sp. SyP6R]|uniref:hypothetical protein n=1 Tax=Methylobacterium sp. SyP6R TaxID=2718876 RepID=UPI001F25C272|nr:hypothetical protein [Methylobacterium sp. SyP6R]MCF4130045.1 hypothetical protein [Methylobacterium sp. SyP6R]